MSTSYIDFSQLKERVAIDHAAVLLNLKLRQHGGQLRGRCPACASGGDRALVITPAKSAFYCFGAKRGGDVIALAAHVLGVTQRDAAARLVEQYGTVPTEENGTSSSTVPPAPAAPRSRFDAAAYLAKLDREAEALQPLGLSPDTLRHFQAGYAGTGVLRGRLALAVAGIDGAVIGFCGIAIGEETPAIVFPNGFPEPASLIFNAHRVGEGELSVVGSPLEVLRAYEGGVDNCVAFFTETLSPAQVEHLAALMDQRKCDLIL